MIESLRVKKFVGMLVAATLSSRSPLAARPIEIHAEPVSAAHAIDATHLRRHSKSEVEVVIAQQARGAGLLTFHLNGHPVAKLEYADWVRLYLLPGRYRFGIAPSPNFGRALFWQMKAEISSKTPHLYRIFQSAGFTSSGGNAVYEISREEPAHSR
jgi:hypothetical protein